MNRKLAEAESLITNLRADIRHLELEVMRLQALLEVLPTKTTTTVVRLPVLGKVT